MKRSPRAIAVSMQDSGSNRPWWFLLWFILFSTLSYWFISHFLVTVVIVQGRSMLPTLHDGDRFMLNRVAYFYRCPRRDELVVLRDPGHSDYAVKRVVALPGEAIHFKNGMVYVNGEKRSEPFLTYGMRTYCPDVDEMLVLLGPKRFFVLGDNRTNSEDSRTYGPIRLSQIIGMIAR